MPQVFLIAHNLRSAHNIGSLLRTADGLGVEGVYLTGYSPHPPIDNDSRLPHISAGAGKKITKTALGAENSVIWRYEEAVETVISLLREQGYRICALEQAPGATVLSAFQAPEKVALIVGREVEGIELEVLELCDEILEIPMAGSKESFNVAQAAAMALYQLMLSKS